ncbi:hypothetical protein HPB47_010310 [Ixodes persulcatus]|uniref:Uncharacterized protein n=1 Tax=Ixodes persulcatus TaxID=34615 RepID=A0AC60NZG8_IXOPE|nr:hypothetical protein HPB47_010310 [Ixodes persulcatus]
MGRFCVPNCRGNYDTGPKVRVFSFPKDDDRRMKWERAVLCDNIEIATLRDPKVCELHFKKEYLKTTTSYTDSDGRTIEAPMSLTRLTPDAVPTIFPNSPAYFSDSAPVREKPEAKRKRRGAKEQSSVQFSLFLPQKFLSSYDQFLSRLPDLHVADFWLIQRAKSAVLFVHIDDSMGHPEVERSVVATDTMKVSASWRRVRLCFDEVAIPETLDDMRQLQCVLGRVQEFKAPDVCEKDEKLKACIELLFLLLDDLASNELLPQEKTEALAFLMEQLHLLLKGAAFRRLRYPNQEPVRALTDMQLEFLDAFVNWLDIWGSVKMDTVTRYCLEELNFEYVLLGKFQTDSLEDRFGFHRRLSGTNYHISVQQIFESETKLRLQGSLVFPDMQELCKPSGVTCDADKLMKDYNIKITENDLKEKEPSLPAITYIAGFCAHAALKKIPCEACALNLVTEERELQLNRNVIIENLTRGGLKFPQKTHIEKKKNATRFHADGNQREVLLSLSRHLLLDNEDLDICNNGHHPDTVLSHILRAAANTLLKDYGQMKTDQLRSRKAAVHLKKLQTLK